jgi:hypothetical protein
MAEVKLIPTSEHDQVEQQRKLEEVLTSERTWLENVTELRHGRERKWLHHKLLYIITWKDFTRLFILHKERRPSTTYSIHKGARAMLTQSKNISEFGQARITKKKHYNKRISNVHMKRKLQKLNGISSNPVINNRSAILKQKARAI